MPEPRTILLTSLAIEPGAVQLKPGRRIGWSSLAG